MKTNDKSQAKNSFSVLSLDKASRRLAFHFLAVIGLTALLLLLLGPGANAARESFKGLAPGELSNRDITAGKDVVYVDEEATRLRRQAEERLVLPTYQLDLAATARILGRYRDFSAAFRELAAQDIALETMVLMLQSRFPGALSREDLMALARSSLKSQALVYAESTLETLLDTGIFSDATTLTERYNQDYFELKRLLEGRTDTSQRAKSSMITGSNLGKAIDEELTKRHLARSLLEITASLIKGFTSENAFFDQAGTEAKLAKALGRIEPVSRSVAKNELLVRKGELVTDATYLRLQAIEKAVSRADISLTLRSLGIFLSAVALGLIFLNSARPARGSIDQRLVLAALYSSFLFFVIALLSVRISGGLNSFDGLYLLPVGVFSGIAAALAGSSFGYFFTVVLSLLAASVSNVNPFYIVFVLLSGILASFLVGSARTRLVLVRSALLQAAFQGLWGIILLLQEGTQFKGVLKFSGMLTLNGFVSGSLILALLPILEQTFNLTTRFRMLELSDVNAPALKNLLTQAPGTYSHSMNVAHLAEAAAEEIGADSLLARVGAYYHDIGKAEQPEYFVENQRGSNKHDDINPRLSATVIRSHVKIGMEKARELKLPKAVVDIVAQHHGNSIIAWFFDKAKIEDESIRKEDFSYPGSPPASKESGIVMLADTVEAASRMLKKPTVTKLDAHIRQLIMEKVQSGQLDNCMLTVRDLESVRHAFVRILSGQFHSRIEYPKQREDRS
jgi:putative nucleotidyltransferase with HDIG domain